MILADTNVISELMKDLPDSRVQEWASRVSPAGIGMSVISIQEIEYGLRVLPDGQRRHSLQRRWNKILLNFAEVIANFDSECAQSAAELMAAERAIGRQISFADSQIAGTCVALGATLATRNKRDFESISSLTVVNPFGDS